MRAAGTLVVVVHAVLSGCEAPREGQRFPECAVTAGGTTTVEALQVISPTVQYFLDVDSGGPLTCVPGPGDACDPCQSAEISVPVGAQTTIAVEVQNSGGIELAIAEAVVDVVAPADATVTVLAPVPLVAAVQSASEVFVGVTPTNVGEVTATLHITTDAGNQNETGEAQPYAIVLRFVGVDD